VQQQVEENQQVRLMVWMLQMSMPEVCVENGLMKLLPLPYKNFDSQIMYEILAYLAENPDAGDTMEGIVEWWLLERTIKRETEKVKDALDELVAQGFVTERKGSSSLTYYRINRRKYRKIQALLEERSK
jgi:hypothetical protein